MSTPDITVQVGLQYHDLAVTYPAPTGSQLHLFRRLIHALCIATQSPHLLLTSIAQGVILYFL